MDTVRRYVRGLVVDTISRDKGRLRLYTRNWVARSSSSTPRLRPAWLLRERPSIVKVSRGAHVRRHLS